MGQNHKVGWSSLTFRGYEEAMRLQSRSETVRNGQSEMQGSTRPTPPKHARHRSDNEAEAHFLDCTLRESEQSTATQAVLMTMTNRWP
ncbi:hypothetical protein C8Q74DRAFT_1288348 [Fomes fomentarius]|nr:hypothetical protein C8Q74DRAFT_1288348 [Fomes fomentarius]